MTLPALNLYEVIWANVQAIANNTDITAYCTEKYGKDITIYPSMPYDAMPTEEQCPCIGFISCIKSEGADELEFGYGWYCRLIIFNPSKGDSTSKIVVEPGFEEVSALWQLIQKALQAASENYPLSSIEVTQGSNAYGQYWIDAFCAVQIQTAIGQDDIIYG